MSLSLLSRTVLLLLNNIFEVEGETVSGRSCLSHLAETPFYAEMGVWTGR